MCLPGDADICALRKARTSRQRKRAPLQELVERIHYEGLALDHLHV